MNPNILFEDEDHYCIEKLQDIHTVEGKNSNSMVEIIKNHFSSTFIKKEKDGGLISRLDYETSGILLGAKTKDSFEKLKLDSKNDLIKKEYIFLTAGQLHAKTSCSLAIGSRSRTSKTQKTFKYPKNKDRALESVTDFYPISENVIKNLSLVQATIYQGRRHQIRVHAKELDLILLGDITYGDTKGVEFGLDKFFLHNYLVEFSHSKTGKIKKIFLPLPDNFKNLLDRFEFTFNDEVLNYSLDIN